MFRMLPAALALVGLLAAASLSSAAGSSAANTAVPPLATTVDATAVGLYSATLGGSVDPRGQATTAYFEYGPGQAYATRTASQPVGAGTGAVSLVHNITSLDPNTTYHFRVVAQNATETAFGNDLTFQTPPLPPTIDPPVISKLTATSVDLVAYVNAEGSETTVYVEYGTAVTLGQTSPSIDFGSSVVPYPSSQSLTGLHDGTTYYYRVVASNSGGGLSTTTSSFTTPSNAPGAPVTGAATPVAHQYALLNGAATPAGVDTFVRFYYGTTGGADESSTPELYVGNGTKTVPVRVFISSLQPGVTYYYRIAARTASGSVYGAVLNFANPDIPPLQAVNDAVVVTGRQAVNIDVLANDLAPTWGDLNIVSVSAAIGGSVTINGDNTLTYQPNSSFSGSDAFTYEMNDGTSQSSFATVLVSSNWRGSAGAYHALVGAADTLFEDAGAVRVTVTAGGSFTGALTRGGSVTPFHGRLQSNSTAALQLKVAGETVDLSLGLDTQLNQLSGTVGLDGSETFPFEASRAVGDTARARPLAGRYTLLFGLYDGNATGEGAGFAAVRVDRRGSAWLTGRGSDGVPFNLSAAIGADGRFPFYVVQGAKHDSTLHGWVEFPDAPFPSDCAGTLGRSAAGYFGSNELLTLTGSTYVPPGRALPLALAAQPGNSLFFFGPATGVPVDDAVATLLHSQLEVPPGGIVSNVRINLANGLLSGVVNLSGQRSPFYGAFYQRGSRAEGVYLGPDGAGWMELDSN